MIYKFLLNNKQARKSVITAALALLSIISLLMATIQVDAWFKSHHTVTTPTAISNFEQKVQYHNGSRWVTLNLNQPIPVKYGDKIRVCIQHKSISATYIRVSVFGNFYNADTGTLLPQSDALFTFDLKDDSQNWKTIKSDPFHIYYANDFYSWDNDAQIPSPIPTTDLEEFTVCVNPKAFPESISEYQDYTGELFVYVDAVQPDRFQEFWGITTLPFTVS